jgi:hypothetical protein
VWRAKTINAVVDSTLVSVGVGTGSSDALKAVHHLLVQDPFTGVGASGVDFLPQPASLPDAEDRRDYTLLAALQTALDVLLGLSRDGEYEVVNTSGFSARASGVNSFRFGGGPVRRYVGQPSRQSYFHQADIQGYNVMPGGPSGVVRAGALRSSAVKASPRLPRFGRKSTFDDFGGMVPRPGSPHAPARVTIGLIHSRFPIGANANAHLGAWKHTFRT